MTGRVSSIRRCGDSTEHLVWTDASEGGLAQIVTLRTTPGDTHHIPDHTGCGGHGRCGQIQAKPVR